MLSLQTSLARLVTLVPKKMDRREYLSNVTEQAFDLLKISVERNEDLLICSAVLIISRISTYDSSKLLVPPLQRLIEGLSVDLCFENDVYFTTSAFMAHALVTGIFSSFDFIAAHFYRIACPLHPQLARAMAAEDGVVAQMLKLMTYGASRDICSDTINSFCVEYFSQVERNLAIELISHLSFISDPIDASSFSLDNCGPDTSQVAFLRRLLECCRGNLGSRLPKIEELISYFFLNLLEKFIKVKSSTCVGDAIILLGIISNFKSNILLYEGRSIAW